MNRFKTTITLSFLLLLFVSSCSSDDDNNSPPESTTFFSMTVNGQSFRPNTEPIAVVLNANSLISMSATNSSTSEIITITIENANDNPLEIGSYNITGTDSTAFNYFDGANGFQSDNGGQITISAIDFEARTISGTFQGVASGPFGNNTTYTISNGQFTDINFTVE